MADFTVTGTKSGLGRLLHEQFGGVAINRATTDSVWHDLATTGSRVIIHCAMPSKLPQTLSELAQYVDDSVNLTNRLLTIDHEQFIYLSSIDVYPKTGEWSEQSQIDLSKDQGLYGHVKLMCESLVSRQSKAPLILRSGAILGPYSRSSNSLRLMRDQDPSLTLSADSTFSYVRASDMVNFVQRAIDLGLTGIYNIAPRESTTLAELSSALRRETVNFGQHRYVSPQVDNRKVCAVAPQFELSSLQTALDYQREML